MSAIVTYGSADRVVEIRFDDGKVNAMALPLFDGLNAALDRAEREEAGAVVLTGRDGFFSAGLDIKLLPTLSPETLVRTLQVFGETLLRVWTLSIPTVAAVTGHAVAGGLFLALACDVRVAARGPFRLHANEHAIGLPLPSWALVITESAVPTAAYNELMLHARPLSPEEALQRGLLNGLEAPDRVVVTARERAAGLTSIAGGAYAVSKRRMRARAVEWARRCMPEELAGLRSSSG
jgi:enoyl-CoA hydratase